MLKRFIRKLRKQNSAPTPAGVPPDPSLTPSQFRELILHVARTHEVELNCSSTFELIDEYAEMAAQGRDAAHIMPQVNQHLEMCPDCSEEYQTLLRILRTLELENEDKLA